MQVQQELPSQATAAWSGSKTITPIQEEDDTIKKCMEMLPAWTGSKKAIPTRNGNNTIQECMEFLFPSPRQALIPSPKLLFALSTSPLDCRCFTKAKRYYLSRKAKVAHYVVPHKLLYLTAANCCHSFCLYPLRKIVHSDYQKLDLSWSLGERISYVNSLLVEWPWSRDGSQRLLGVSWHGTMSLTIFTFAYHIPCFSMRGWPVISQLHGFGHHGR
ncbi:hypothetical protein Tco_0768036 [Tanacetum coccineum]